MVRDRPDTERPSTIAVTPGEVRAALADAATVGPFFDLPPVTAADGWVPFARLHADPAPLSDRIAAVRDALGTDRRVAASIAFQGLVARLVSAPLAAVALHGVLPDLSTLARRPAGEDPWAPGLLDAAGAGASSGPDPAGVADALADALVVGALEPLVEVVAELAAVSRQVLWGNAGSALAGSARVLDTMRPDARASVVGVLARLLEHPTLGGTGRLLRLEPDVPDTEWGFRRHSCCLYYRVPGGGTCGDCVLTAPRR